ncbi:MAG: hypothetical protein ACK2T6_04175 [Anaerolineae bacterium]|jgi:hypothetical protein
MTEEQRAGGPSGSSARRWLVTFAAAVGVVLTAYAIGARLQGAPNGGGAAAVRADSCRGVPAFLADLGFGSNVLVDTTQALYTGLAIREAGEDGRSYQHPTWDDAGNVGPYALDRHGNIYVAPVPLVSMARNLPEEQNRVYRVDGATGEMALYADLPRDVEPSGANPYGVVGMTYDCDTDSLYVTSVAGSGPDDERGRIHRLDTRTGEVMTVLDGFDALGVAIARQGGEKRLYVGGARRPAIYSLAVAPDGGLVGPPRLEVDLADIPGSSFDKIARIRFDESGQMTATGIEFSYSLKAASDPGANLYHLRYDAGQGEWVPVAAAD